MNGIRLLDDLFYNYSKFQVNYEREDNKIIRSLKTGRFSSSSYISPILRNNSKEELAYTWNLNFLAGAKIHTEKKEDQKSLNIVDLFCGCGGLSYGLKLACEAAGVRPVFQMAVDLRETALDIYKKNIRPLRVLRENVRNLIDFQYTEKDGELIPDFSNLFLHKKLEVLNDKVDVLLAGPPCEGNSNLNNKTRRSDERNELYFNAILGGIALGAKVIIIENVTAVRHSKQNVVSQSIKLLHANGYKTNNEGVILTASDFGTPQLRKRHFLIGYKSDLDLNNEIFDLMKVKAPFVDKVFTQTIGKKLEGDFNTSSNVSPKNQERMDYLDRTGLINLPDSERPDCHRLKPHTYPSVYGRIEKNSYSGTITTGFLSPGRGRFTHPFEARGLTPHEGARLQGFPNHFDWLTKTSRIGRNNYANIIGDAVPPQFGYAIGLGAISIF